MYPRWSRATASERAMVKATHSQIIKKVMCNAIRLALSRALALAVARARLTDFLDL